MTDKKNKIRTPYSIFFMYVFFMGALIMIFRFIFPGAEVPLSIYSRDWKLIQGLLEFFKFFPALAFSALIIPFGFVAEEENLPSFSDIFFKRLLVSVITAICAAVIYGIIFFLAMPVAKSSEENMRYKGEVFKLAKKHALDRRDAGEWQEAAQFLAVCDVIWLNSPELTSLKAEVDINVQRIKAQESREVSQVRASFDRDWRSAELTALSGGQQPVNSTQAIAMGTTAFNEKRYFDAHWLATLGTRLAISGSPEAANAARLASEAWNMIAAQRPNQREEHFYEIYNLKLSGYLAMNTGDWIRAYYIFQELISLTPDDPDVVNFYALSERGAKEYAFFIDEMELSVGMMQTNSLFSLPAQNSRAVLRFSSLTMSDDVAYGIDLEYMSFDAVFRPAESVRARYAKLLPVTLSGKQQVLVLMHALDRFDKDSNYESEWLFGEERPGGIFLDISYEDLLLFSHIRQGLSNLQINELFSASGKVETAGYIPQIFQAEILNRIGSVLFFLPMAVFSVVIGWRYRAKKRPRYIFAMMLLILPVVLHGLVFLYRSVINTLGIWLVLSIGFTPALVVFIAAMTVMMFISLITLAAQHT